MATTAARVLIACLFAGGAAAPASAAERLCDPSFQNCRTPLLDLIKNERAGIDVAFWFMEDTRYVTALVERWRAGVPVRVIMDTQANASYPYNAQVLQSLRSAGIPMREKTSGGIVHWKTMIFAGQHVVQFSGANYSPHAFRPSLPYVDFIDEVIYFTDDPDIVNSFKRKYDDAWTATSGYRAYANISATTTREYPKFSIDPEMNFVPGQDFGARSVTLYNAESSGIDAVIYRITDRRHTDALIAARKRGVRVRVITEPAQYRDRKRLWHSWNVDRMYMAGIQIRHRAHRGWLHQKTTVLRGQRRTIFGSSNWTSPSATSQLEHNIFTAKSLFYDYFTKLFDRKWGNRTGHTETKAFQPLAPDAPSTPFPANGATGQPLTVRLKWNGGPWAHRYDVYFGTDPGALTKVRSDAALGPSETSTHRKSHAVSGLSAGRTYYWKVVSRTMANKTRSGPVWSFRTR